MGVNLGPVPANPGAEQNIFDQILGGAGPLGQALASGLDGIVGFIGDVFKGVVTVGGQILEGAVNLVEGAFKFLGDIGRMIASIFSGKPPAEPLPEIWSPIKADLEAELKPFLDTVNESITKSEAAGSQSQAVMDELDSLLEEGNEDSPLWDAQQRINRLETERNDAQDTAIRALALANEAMQQYVSRGLFLPDSTKVGAVDNPHWRVTFKGGKRKLVAQPGWVGEWVYQSAVHRSGDFGPVIAGGEITPTGREFLLDTATSSAVLMYWIRPGTAMVFPEDNVTVTNFVPTPRDTWITLTDYSFTVKEAVEHSIFFRVGWDATTRNDSYGLQILHNGQVVETKKEVGIGPLIPGQNGYRTQALTIPARTLSKNDTITFQIWAGATGTAQRKMRDSKVQIGWVKPAGASDIT